MAWQDERVLLDAILPLVLAAAPAFETDYSMQLAGVRVGSVQLKLEGEAEKRFGYRSETFVRRGPVVVHNESRVDGELGADGRIRSMSAERLEGGVLVRSVRARATGDGLQIETALSDGHVEHRSAPAASCPSAIAPLLLQGSEQRCLPVIEETTGTAGEACGALEAGRVRGKLLGEPFVARIEQGVMVTLELPASATVFERDSRPAGKLAPPDLFSEGVEVEGLRDREEAERVRFSLAALQGDELPQSASQSARRVGERWRVRWSRAEPAIDEPLRKPRALGGPLDTVARDVCGGLSGRWEAARAITEQVHGQIEDDRPFPGERSAERVYAERRGSCVGHVELMLALARRCGLPARRAVGLVASEGRLWGHAWAQVQVGGRWFDVDPAEGEAPARAARIALGVGEESGAGRLLSRLATLGVRVEAPAGK